MEAKITITGTEALGFLVTLTLPGEWARQFDPQNISHILGFCSQPAKFPALASAKEFAGWLSKEIEIANRNLTQASVYLEYIIPLL